MSEINEWKDLAAKWEALATASVSDALGWKRRASAAERHAYGLREALHVLVAAANTTTPDPLAMFVAIERAKHILEKEQA